MLNLYIASCYNGHCMHRFPSHASHTRSHGEEKQTKPEEWFLDGSDNLGQFALNLSDSLTSSLKLKRVGRRT